MATNILHHLKYTKQELDNYVSDKSSCIQFITDSIHIDFPPKGLSNFKEMINAIISHNKIGKYDQKLDGIILDVRNIKVMGQHYPTRNDYADLHIDLLADFYLFKPEIGATITGKVKHISKGHLGVIIYRVFNVSVKLRKLSNPNITINSDISLKIINFNIQNQIPHIEGELICQSDYRMSNTITANVNKKIIFNDEYDDVNVDDSGISTTEEIHLIQNNMQSNIQINSSSNISDTSDSDNDIITDKQSNKDRMASQKEISKIKSKTPNNENIAHGNDNINDSIMINLNTVKCEFTNNKSKTSPQKSTNAFKVPDANIANIASIRTKRENPATIGLDEEEIVAASFITQNRNRLDDYVSEEEILNRKQYSSKNKETDQISKKSSKRKTSNDIEKVALIEKKKTKYGISNLQQQIKDLLQDVQEQQSTVITENKIISETLNLTNKEMQKVKNKKNKKDKNELISNVEIATMLPKEQHINIGENVIHKKNRNNELVDTQSMNLENRNCYNKKKTNETIKAGSEMEIKDSQLKGQDFILENNPILKKKKDKKILKANVEDSSIQLVSPKKGADYNTTCTMNSTNKNDLKMEKNLNVEMLKQLPQEKKIIIANIENNKSSKIWKKKVTKKLDDFNVDKQIKSKKKSADETNIETPKLLIHEKLDGHKDILRNMKTATIELSQDRKNNSNLKRNLKSKNKNSNMETYTQIDDSEINKNPIDENIPNYSQFPSPALSSTMQLNKLPRQKKKSKSLNEKRNELLRELLLQDLK